MKHSKIDKIYKKIQNKYPNITNEAQIESLVRKYILRKKVIICTLIFLSSLAAYLLMINLDVFVDNPDSIAYENISSLLLGWYGLGSIVSVMMFAKALHNPLTPNEEIEL